MLLLRQSMEQRAIGSRIPQLNLNGSLIEAGTFDDIVHGHDTSQPIGFHFDVTVELAFPRSARAIQEGLVPLDVPRPPAPRFWFPDHDAYEFLRRQRKLKTGRVSISLYFLPEPPFGPTLSRLSISVADVGQVNFVRTVGERRVQHWRAYASSFPSTAVRILFPQWSFFPVVSGRQSSRSKAPAAERHLVREFLVTAQLAANEVALYISSLRLLGPFRTPPARRYTFSGIGAVDAGSSGERAVDLLITEKLIRAHGEPLRVGVSYWLKRLGLARTIRIRDVAKKSNIFELSVSGAGAARIANFADVGFGVSQVLPVLVQGFLVPRGGTYIVQQPELHLHPDAQAGLADFFLYLASRGVRTIVETHSEYLLLRLRRRLAETIKPVTIGIPGEKVTAPLSLGKGDISIVYVGEENGNATLRPLEIGSSFQFENMPRGFMSQALDDRLALLRALK